MESAAILKTEEFKLSDTIIFHGSNVIVEHPQILENGYYKDFGYGFYCTQIEKQAKRWALTKRKNLFGIISKIT